jgi:hypothetical protein
MYNYSFQNFFIAWKNNLLFLFLCIFPLITIALSISFTIKWRLFVRKEWLAKRNKATLISLRRQGRETSADIGREFHPLRQALWNQQKKRFLRWLCLLSYLSVEFIWHFNSLQVNIMNLKTQMPDSCWYCL